MQSARHFDLNITQGMTSFPLTNHSEPRYLNCVRATVMKFPEFLSFYFVKIFLLHIGYGVSVITLLFGDEI